MPKVDIPAPKAEATVTVTSPDGDERTVSTKDTEDTSDV